MKNFEKHFYIKTSFDLPPGWSIRTGIIGQLYRQLANPTVGFPGARGHRLVLRYHTLQQGHQIHDEHRVELVVESHVVSGHPVVRCGELGQIKFQGFFLVGQKWSIHFARVFIHFYSAERQRDLLVVFRVVCYSL